LNCDTRTDTDRLPGWLCLGWATSDEVLILYLVGSLVEHMFSSGSKGGRKGLGFVLKVGVADGNGAFLTTGHICHNLPLCSSSQSYLQDTISPMPMRYQPSSEFGLYLKVPCFYDWVHMSLLITIIDSCFPVCFLLLLLVNEWEGSSSEIWNLRI